MTPPTEYSLAIRGSQKMGAAELTLGVAAKGVLDYVRSVSNSGSDPVAEEDLALLFGAPMIDPQLAQAFKNTVQVPASVQPKRIWGSILLHIGAGPTVQEAFKRGNQSPKLAMVVQLSFLAGLYTHECLARAISAHYQRADNAKPEDASEVLPRPDEEKIRAVLIACQEQTAKFNWEQYLYEVAARLGFTVSTDGETYPDHDKAIQPIDATIFQGLLVAILEIGRNTSQQSVEIRTHGQPIGVCAIVVWVHHILGLNVDVYSQEKGNYVRFIKDTGKHLECFLRIPPYDPRHAKEDGVPCVQVYETVEDDKRQRIFAITKSDEDVPLENHKIFKANGYGIVKLLDAARAQLREPVVYELALMTCGFALHVSKHLSYQYSSEPCVVRDPSQTALEPVTISDRTFCQAADYLFGYTDDTRPSDFDIVAMRKRSHALVGDTESLSLVVRNHLQGHASETRWKGTGVRATVIKLATVLLALCHVSDLETCRGLEFTQFGGSTFELFLRSWDGSSKLGVPADTWFLSMIQLVDLTANEVQSGPDPNAVERKALISQRGWSILVNTLNRKDPFYLSTGGRSIEEGVPKSGEHVKRTIMDGSGANLSPRASFTQLVGPVDYAKCLFEVHTMRSRVTQPQDRFIVQLRFGYGPPGSQPLQNSTELDPSSQWVVYTGIKELYDSMATVHRTDSCDHMPLKPGPIAVELEHHAIAVKEYIGIHRHRPEALRGARVWVCPTAGITQHRWYTLWWLSHQKSISSRVMLKGHECCAACAIEQASSMGGEWCVVL